MENEVCQMASLSLENQLIEQGFVRGVIVQFKDHANYGIFTGRFRECDGTILEMVGGNEWNSVYCNLITDVNSSILRFVNEKCAEIKKEAEDFTHDIAKFMNNLIYPSHV